MKYLKNGNFHPMIIDLLRVEVINTIQWYINKWPQHIIKLTEVLERAKKEDFSDFIDLYEVEKHYELECDLVINPPDSNMPQCQGWSDYV